MAGGAVGEDPAGGGSSTPSLAVAAANEEKEGRAGAAGPATRSFRVRSLRSPVSKSLVESILCGLLSDLLGCLWVDGGCV